MPVCDAHKFIYVHIPKCAGSSITAAFQAKAIKLDLVGRVSKEEQLRHGISDVWWQHVPSGLLEKILPAGKWLSYFKFTFVRNPWDRAVSYYFYHQRRIKNSPDFRKSYPAVVEAHNRAENFAGWIREGAHDMVPQAYYIAGQDKTPCLDFVGKYENLAVDLGQVCEKLGIQVEIPHKNKTYHAFYRHYYTDETAAIVRERFQNDVNMFEYSF